MPTFPVHKLAEEEFPALLMEIPQPPKELYLRGTLTSDVDVRLAVVGSRAVTSYGQEACRALIAGLRGAPITIVSGLALGVDAIAHETALAAGLGIIAVPGSGLSDEVLYPRANLRLAHKILAAGGALLSEFPADLNAAPWTFPQRNRIMAGLSRAVLIIEAEEKSGTLITARMAVDYNRDVLVVPGSINARNSRGTNALIRQGATPITSPDDILEALGFERRDDARAQGARTLENLSPEERIVIEHLREPRTRDELMHALKLPISSANILLSAMEIKGLIKEELGKVRAV